MITNLDQLGCNQKGYNKDFAIINLVIKKTNISALSDHKTNQQVAMTLNFNNKIRPIHRPI